MIETLLFILTVAQEVFGLVASRILDQLTARIHYYSYRPSPSPKNVVVIGGSYAGYFCAETLAKSLPSGWKVTLIEKNECFMHTWLFPRISVIKRHTNLAFIPYPSKLSWAPTEVFELMHATVTEAKCDEKSLILQDGSEIPFEYLVLATGLAGRYPAGVDGKGKQETVKYLRKQQEEVEASDRIVVIGGGPVGVEIALDIKSEYPDKQVTLIHSRDRLAHGYVAAVHQICVEACDRSGIRVILYERPQLDSLSKSEVKLSTGEIVEYDLVIKCTGFATLTDTITGLPKPSMNVNGLIRVKSTLQIDHPNMPTIFAVGDVADTGVTKMGRAAALQGLTAAKNIIRQISGKSPKDYRPGVIERSLDLTLGLTQHLMHVQGSNDESTLQFQPQTKDESVGAMQMWKQMDQAVPMGGIEQSVMKSM